MTPVSHGKPCAGNPHARFEEGASAQAEPRRSALLHTIWIGSITDSSSGAFSLYSNQVSFVSKKGSVRVLAHELGHLLGLHDIYDKRGVGEMPGTGYQVRRDCFDNHLHDWGGESGRGFYPAEDTHGVIIQSLLMYGCDPSPGCDLPHGSVEGFGKFPSNIFNKVFINVGAGGIVRP